MRIEVLRDPGGPGRRLGEEAERGGLLRELSARGFEVAPRDPEPPVPVPGATPLPPGEPAGRDAAPAPGADVAPAVPTSEADVAPAPPVPEALLVCGRAEEPAGNRAIAGWLKAARNAARAGRPVVLTGLVIGGADEPAEGLAELLATAALVGLRDEASLERARRLCPRHPALRLGRDDLLALPPLAAPDPARGEEPALPPGGRDQDPGPRRLVAAVGRPAGPFRPEETAPVLAALLDALVHRTGAAVTLLPRTDSTADAEFTAAVAALLPGDVPRREADLDPAADAVVGAADWLVTTGRNAAALGLAGGAGVLPIAVDEYSLQCMEGVLEHWGVAGHAVPLAALLTPGEAAWDTRAAVQQWAAEALEDREAVRAAVAAAEPGLRAASALWWDAVADTLRGGHPRRPGSGTAPPVAAVPVMRALRRRYTVPAVPADRPTVAVVLRVPAGSVPPQRALEDLLAQTFTDWRLVLVEDGGDPAAVAALLERHSRRLAGRATAVHHQRALGPGAAANRGLRAGNSELVVLQDPHQRWHPVLLQAAVARLENPLVTDDGVLVSAQGSPPTAAPDEAREPRDGTVLPLALADVLDGVPAAPAPSCTGGRCTACWGTTTRRSPPPPSGSSPSGSSRRSRWAGCPPARSPSPRRRADGSGTVTGTSCWCASVSSGSGPRSTGPACRCTSAGRSSGGRSRWPSAWTPPRDSPASCSTWSAPSRPSSSAWSGRWPRRVSPPSAGACGGDCGAGEGELRRTVRQGAFHL